MLQEAKIHAGGCQGHQNGHQQVFQPIQ
jgi:hypothetical protein